MKDIEKLVVLGPPGSYLDGLARSMDMGYPLDYGANFEIMIAQAEASPSTAILLPIKNTMKGPLSDVVGAFQDRRLRVEGISKLDVISNIMGIGDPYEATCIAGKDVALDQIRTYRPDLTRVPMDSTSAAGMHIRDTGDRTMLSVGALAQADIYGLNVIDRGVQDKDGINQTTVLIVRGRNGWQQDPDEIVLNAQQHGTAILRTTDSTRPASLYRALREIAERDINLTNIESLNIRGTVGSEFFITFYGIGRAIKDLMTSSAATQHMSLEVFGIYAEPITYSS